MKKIYIFIILTLIEIYTFYELFFGDYEFRVNIPWGGMRLNYMVLGIFWAIFTLTYINYFIKNIFLKDYTDYGKEQITFFVIMILGVLVFNIFWVSNQNVNFYMNFGNTIDKCPQIYEVSQDMMTESNCDLEQLTYEQAKEVAWKKYPIYTRFANKHIAWFLRKI